MRFSVPEFLRLDLQGWSKIDFYIKVVPKIGINDANDKTVFHDKKEFNKKSNKNSYFFKINVKKLLFFKQEYQESRIVEGTEQIPKFLFLDSFLKLNSLHAYIKKWKI